uniref:Macro domain-containing protein n=1 Tax=Hucho hucho TaxID=62062 RepID=A0A4W5MCW6_9TELE
MKSGVISKAIWKAAGQDIQKEIRKHFNSNTYGEVIETKGHKLPCHYVYHTISPYKSQVSEKSLGDIVSKCLGMAQNRQLSSISFPVIGTGVLGFSKLEVAKIMMDTAVTFSQHKNVMNMDIYYVIYPSDNEAYKAFEDKLKGLQDVMKYPSSSNSASSQGEILVKLKGLQDVMKYPSSSNSASSQGEILVKLKGLQDVMKYPSSSNSASSQGEILVKRSR